MKDKLKMGVIDCGRISVMRFALAKYGENKAYTDYREMLDNENLGAVVHLYLSRIKEFL